MIKRDVVILHSVLAGFQGPIKSTKFNYAVIKNKKRLLEEVESIEEVNAASSEFMAYEQKRVKLCESHAKKGEDGKPLIEQDNFVLEDKEKFDKEFKALSEEHKEVVEARKEQTKQVQELLEQPSDVKLHKIKLEELPEDLEAATVEAILPMIWEEE